MQSVYFYFIFFSVFCLLKHHSWRWQNEKRKKNNIYSMHLGDNHSSSKYGRWTNGIWGLKIFWSENHVEFTLNSKSYLCGCCTTVPKDWNKKFPAIERKEFGKWGMETKTERKKKDPLFVMAVISILFHQIHRFIHKIQRTCSYHKHIGTVNFFLVSSVVFQFFPSLWNNKFENSFFTASHFNWSGLMKIDHQRLFVVYPLVVGRWSHFFFHSFLHQIEKSFHLQRFI